MKKFLKSESGQGMVEYALILTFVSVVAIAILTSLGKKVSERFKEVDTALTQQPPS